MTTGLKRVVLAVTWDYSERYREKEAEVRAKLAAEGADVFQPDCGRRLDRDRRDG